MQFKSIVAVLSLALAATAIPLDSQAANNLFERTGSSSNKSCSPTQTAVFCTEKDDVLSGALGGLLTLQLLTNLLSGGVLTNILKCVPVLSGNNANACCDTSGVQKGLVNVGTPCVVVG